MKRKQVRERGAKKTQSNAMSKLNRWVGRV
jgi:hypothetical protein